MARPKRDLVRANFYLQTNVMTGLQKLAKLKATTVSELVRLSLRQYVLDELEKETIDDHEEQSTDDGQIFGSRNEESGREVSS